MLVLPEHLAPLLRPEPHLDVLGTSDPWVLPPDWLETVQQQVKALAEDPRGQGGTPPAGVWKGVRRAPCRSCGTWSPTCPA